MLVHSGEDLGGGAGAGPLSPNFEILIFAADATPLCAVGKNVVCLPLTHILDPHLVAGNNNF